jgi:hypothetical protein
MLVPCCWERGDVGKKAAIGLAALGIVVGSGLYAFSRTEYVGRCPADRALFISGGYARDADAEPYETMVDAAKISAENHYGELGPSDIEKIAESAAAAEPSVSPTAIVTYTFDPDLPDTEAVVDLHITVEEAENGGYWPAGGSFCARVVSAPIDD